MIAAVSRPAGRTDTTRSRRQAATAPTAPAAKSVPWYSREGVYFAAVRDVSDKTRAEMHKRQCALTWYLLHEALHDEARRGRTEAIRDAARRCILDDVGIMGLHRISGGDGRRGGVSPKTIRRHLEVLEGLGLVKVCRPPVRFVLRDGRLHKARGQGREKPVRIIITVDAEKHCRPSKRQVIGQAARRAVASSYGASVPTTDPVLMGRGDAPSIDSREQKESETPADTVGVGAAVASTDAGLTAGQAGSREPAEAGGLAAAVHEGGQADADPVLPPPRRRQARQASTPRQTPRQPGTDEAPAKTAAEKSADWNRGLAESARTCSAYLAARKAGREAAKASTPARPPSTPTTPERASGDDLDALATVRRRDEAAARKAVFRNQWRTERGLPAVSLDTTHEAAVGDRDRVLAELRAWSPGAAG